MIATHRRLSRLRLGVLLAGAMFSTAGAAAQYALLVGVSRYPELAPEHQLQAPANDVRLMREVLVQRGFEAAHIEVLADGVQGAQPPTHGAIVSALQRLGARVRKADTVYLHFSGHGSLQHLDPRAATPVPRWQPVFLPRDVRAWSGSAAAAIPNAITDTALRGLIDRINDAGAFVFVVFDACHSARLVRGAAAGGEGARLRWRHVDPGALGMSGEPPLQALPVWFVPGQREAAGATRGASTPGATEPDRGRGQAAYFYAAQSLELAASLPQRTGGRPVWHGLFTWHIAQALALGEPLTHRQLGQHILSRYDQLPATTATPLFSGDGLDEAVFGRRAPSVRQWPVQRFHDQLALPAGALSGLAEGALLALLADPLAPAEAAASGAAPGRTSQPVPRGTLGFVRLRTLEADRAALEPVAWLGWAAPVATALPPGIWARLAFNPPAFGLRVAIDSSRCPGKCAAARAIELLRRDGVPGVDVRWVEGAHADVTLRGSQRGVHLLLAGVEPPNSAWGAWSHAATSASDAAVDALREELAGAIHRVARMRNLLQLAARLATRAQPAGLELRLKAKRQGSTTEVQVTPDQFVQARAGDLLILEGHNAGGDPLDLAVFWLGADQGVRRIFPLDARDSPRLAAGERLRPIGIRIDPGSAGTERLLVLSMPMRRGHEARDFRFLEQPPLARLRGADDADLQALLDACFADYRLRSSAAPVLPAEQLGMRAFAFRIEP